MESKGGQPKVHRFWIEPGIISYNLNEKDDKILISFDKVSMCVKKHLMKYDKDGKLVDDDESDEL